MLFLWDALKITLFLVIIPAFLILLIRQLSEHADQELVNHFGARSQIYIGGLGIIIHELSHLFFAVIFRHHIDDVCLLRFPNRNDPTDRTLGYVRHSWSPHSVYQSIGNAFIGPAPVICSTLIIYAILRSLNAPFAWIHQELTLLFLNHNFTLTSIFNCLKQAFQVHLGSWPLTIIELLIIISICFGGFDLSHEDLKNSRTAFLALIILVFLSSLLLIVLHGQNTIPYYLISFGVWLYLLLFLSIFVLLILNIAMSIFAFLF